MNRISNSRNKFNSFTTIVCISLICIFFVPTASAGLRGDFIDHIAGGTAGPNGTPGGGSGSQPPVNEPTSIH